MFYELEQLRFDKWAATAPNDIYEDAASRSGSPFYRALSVRSTSTISIRLQNRPPPYLNAISNVRFRIGLFEMDIKYGGGQFRDLVEIAPGDPTGFCSGSHDDYLPLLHFPPSCLAVPTMGHRLGDIALEIPKSREYMEQAKLASPTSPPSLPPFGNQGFTLVEVETDPLTTPIKSDSAPHCMSHLLLFLAGSAPAAEPPLTVPIKSDSIPHRTSHLVLFLAESMPTVEPPFSAPIRSNSTPLHTLHLFLFLATVGFPSI